MGRGTGVLDSGAVADDSDCASSARGTGDAPLCVVFFAFFGTTVGARTMYIQALETILRTVGLAMPKIGMGLSTTGTIFERTTFASSRQT